MDADGEEPPPPPPPVSPPPDLGLFLEEEEEPGEDGNLEQPPVSEVSLFLDDSPSTAADFPAPPTPEGNPPQLFADTDYEPPPPPIPTDSPPPVAPLSPPPPDLFSEEELPDEIDTPPSVAATSAPWRENSLLATSAFTSQQTHSLDLEELEDIHSQASDLTPTQSSSQADDHFPQATTMDRTPSSEEEEEASSATNSIPTHTPSLSGSQHDNVLQELTTSDEEDTHTSHHPVSTGPTVIDIMVLQHDEELDEADLPPLPSSLPPDLPSSLPPDLPGSPPPDFPPSLPPEESDLSLFTEEDSNTPQADLSEEDQPPPMPPAKSSSLALDGDSPSTETKSFLRPSSSPATRTTRSHSTILTGSQEYLLQPNLKRWDATDLTDIGRPELHTDEQQQSSSNDLRTVRSAIEVTSRPRTSSGISWISTGTSLESISESDSYEPRPGSGKGYRRPHSYMNEEKELPEDELTSSASIGNMLSGKHTSSSSITRPRSSNLLLHSKGQGSDSYFSTHRPFSYTEQSTTQLFLEPDNKPSPVSPPEDSPPPSPPPSPPSSPLQSAQSKPTSDTESVNSAERTLERIGRDMPKSISGLLDSVVSDIPSLLHSTETTDAPVEDTSIPGDHTPTMDPDPASDKQTTPPPPLPPPREIPLSKWSVDDVSNWLCKNGFEEYIAPFKTKQISGAALIQLDSQQLRLFGVKDTQTGEALLRAVIELKGTPAKQRARFQSPAKAATSDSPLTVEKSHKPESQSSESSSSSQSMPLKAAVGDTTASSRPHRSGVGTQRRQVIKVYFHHIDCKLNYKVFPMDATTTSHKLVTLALERANINQDPHNFTIQQISSTTGGIVKVLAKDDYLVKLPALKVRTHFELRRVTSRPRTVLVPVGLPGDSQNTVDMTVSSSTTSQQLIQQAVKRMDKPVDSTHLKLLVTNKNTKEECLLEDSAIVLQKVSAQSSCRLVNRATYHVGERRKPNTPAVLETKPQSDTAAAVDEVTTSITQDHKERITTLEQQLAAKDAILEQLRNDLREKEEAKDKLMDCQKTMATMDAAFKQQQEFASQSIKELKEQLAQSLADIAKKNQTILEMTAKSNRSNEEIERRISVISDLEIAVEQYKTTADRTASVEESERVRSLERTLAAHISTIQSMTEGQQLLSGKVSELEAENASLNSSLQLGYSNNANSTFRRSNLYNILVLQPLQVIVPVKMEPTKHGLGVQLTNSYEEKGGCIVKTVADTSNAKSLLRPGDRLLEVNGIDVSTSTHKEVSELLQSHQGTVQVAVTRLLNPDETSLPQRKEESSSRVEAKKLKHSNSTLLLQLGEQTSLLESLQDECERLKLESISRTDELNKMEDELQQRDQEIDRITGDCNSYKTELTQLQAAGAALKGTDDDSHAKPSRGELLEEFMTLEKEHARNKRYLDQLLAVVVQHHPSLLSILAQLQNGEDEDDEEDDEGWC